MGNMGSVLEVSLEVWAYEMGLGFGLEFGVGCYARS